MDHWNYNSRAGQQQGHSQAGQLGYPPGSYSSQQGAAAVATPYGSQLFSQPGFGQAFGQQILGAGGKSAGSDDYQGAAMGSAGLTGIYGLDSKFSGSGFSSVGASPATFNQKTDQLSALGQYSKSQSQFLTADGHGDALKRYSESQLLQTALRQGTALDAGVRSQADYLSAGRSSVITAAGGGAYGSGRELLGSAYGVTRSEAEAALLGSQVGLTARGVLPFQSQAADTLGSLAGGRGLLGAMYPPGASYSSLDLASARSGISGMSDLAGIGSARYDDRLDDRMALRYDYDRRDDDRRIRERSRERDRGRERERERERSWERERERERERLRERERVRERERLRDKERARERERDREREQRRRERSPPRILPPPKRDEKVGKKFSPPPARFSSPHKLRKREYVCKVEPFSLAERERDLLSIIRRYPRLYVAADFSKVVTCWKEQGFEIAFNQPVSFELDAVDAEDESNSKDAAVNSSEDANGLKESIVWSVKVMLMSGASGESLKELLSDSPNEEKPLHVHNFLRFLVFRKDRSALMAVGGAWDKMLDGGDPPTDESALIHTAIRCTRDATQLDLSRVSSWKRIMEVHYDRVRDNSSTYKEITVFFIPDLSECLPSLDSWKLQWKQHREARLKREASQKQEKEDGKSGGSPKDSRKKDKAEKQQNKDTKEEEKDTKKEEKGERDAKKDDCKEKEIKEDKQDAKKEEKKEEHKKEEKKDDKNDKEQKKEEKKDDKNDKEHKKEEKKDDKNDKDLKKEDKKEKEIKHEENKEKDVKKEEKKQKDRKIKEERKDKEEKRDEEKKEEKKDEKDVKATKGRGSDKKGKGSSEIEAPEVPGFFVNANRIKTGKARLMTISLDGLLEYDERDKEESTFELSLFAEVFQEMLQYRFGSHILAAFESFHRIVLGRRKDDKKRSRNEKDTKTTTKKKSKFSDSATLVTNTEIGSDKVASGDAVQAVDQEKKDDPKPVKDIDAAMQEASLINFDELEDELQETPEAQNTDVQNEDGPTQEANETKKAVRNVVVDEELLKAFRYFDRNRLNYLKAEDVRRLVHILGRCLTRRWVKDLSTSALSESRSKDDNIYYQKLVEKEVV